MFGQRSFRVFLVLVGLAMASLTPWVMADTVDNPGTFTIYATSGYIKVGNNQFNINPDNPPAISGTIDAGGNVVIPTAGIVFPDTVVSVPAIGDVTVRIAPQSDGTGTLNPITGDAAFSISIKILLINRLLGSNCGIGPVTAIVTTGDSGSLTGVPYDQTVGTATYVNNEFAVPRSSGCGLLGSLLDTFAGLPSAPGNNAIRLVVLLDPIITGS